MWLVHSQNKRFGYFTAAFLQQSRQNICLPIKLAWVCLQEINHLKDVLLGVVRKDCTHSFSNSGKCTHKHYTSTASTQHNQCCERSGGIQDFFVVWKFPRFCGCNVTTKTILVRIYRSNFCTYTFPQKEHKI